MASVPTALLQSIADVLARVPVDPADLAANVVQLGAQLDGLAHLDELDLLNVEPAIVFLLPTEVADARYANSAIRPIVASDAEDRLGDQEVDGPARSRRPASR